eukprot:3746852-Prymnesium_polylepis.2
MTKRKSRKQNCRRLVHGRADAQLLSLFLVYLSRLWVSLTYRAVWWALTVRQPPANRIPAAYLGVVAPVHRIMRLGR